MASARFAATFVIVSVLCVWSPYCRGAKYVETPYSEPKVVFDFFFDHPEKVGPALFWVRALMNPLTEAPYNMAPEFMDVVIVSHGTEIVTLAKKNYERYRDAVERMRYYALLGVKIKVCALAIDDYGYAPKDFYDFVEVVPSAIAELVHWQRQGHALVTPYVMERTIATDDIR